MSSVTKSCWSDPPLQRSGENIEGSPAFDVCVVGAGIAGLTTAYLLAKSGRSVAVLESRDEFAGGETEFTTAHLSNAIDDGFVHIEKIRGTEFARLAYESHATAIDMIESIVTDERIDCDFVRLPGYLFPATHDGSSLISDELLAARRAGASVSCLNYVPLPRCSTGPCLKFEHQGEFHPLKYLEGVARAFRALGGRIFTGVRVEHIEGGPLCRITIRGGSTVTAKAVVVATNTPLAGGPILNTKLAAYTTYAIAIDVPANTVLKALFWDTDDPYHYVRIKPGDRENDVLIVGGEDHKTGQADDQADRWSRLIDWARLRFPDAGTIRAHWSGQVFETLDGLALIGPDPAGADNVYIATGDSGMGMTHGTIAGIILTDLIRKQANPWTALYDPSRLPTAATGTYLAENTNMASQFVDWVTPGQLSNAAELTNGTGGILRQGLRKLALYRDGAGELHSSSATCPHYGCIVHWNTAEATWDCPCHGSRFTGEGQLFHGPASSDLTSVPFADAGTPPVNR